MSGVVVLSGEDAEALRGWIADLQDELSTAHRLYPRLRVLMEIERETAERRAVRRPEPKEIKRDGRKQPQRKVRRLVKKNAERCICGHWPKEHDNRRECYHKEKGEYVCECTRLRRRLEAA